MPITIVPQSPKTAQTPRTFMANALEASAPASPCLRWSANPAIPVTTELACGLPAMDAFDLGRLTDVDFEAVCKDLFEELLQLRLELFAPGADEGIDLRHLRADGGTIVIQCKHWWRSGRARLIRHLAETEAPKVLRLEPARYMLATSVDLTPQAKASIVKALAPHPILPGDIYGVREIESELRNRSHIVRRHLRLWLSGSFRKFVEGITRRRAGRGARCWSVGRRGRFG